MITTLLIALLLGIVIGPLARLVLPGKQHISVPMTIMLGAAGSLIGSWLLVQFGSDGETFSFWGLLAGVAVAAVLVLVYGSVTGRGRPSERRP